MADIFHFVTFKLKNFFILTIYIIDIPKRTRKAADVAVLMSIHNLLLNADIVHIDNIAIKQLHKPDPIVANSLS